MMNRFCILIISIFLSACNSSGQTEVKPGAEKANIQQTDDKKTNGKGQTLSSRRMLISTSRPKSKVEQQFPYDIDLKTASGEVLNSAEVLKDNDKPLVLLFWLTTCAPCRMELAAISKQYEAWQEEVDFRLVAISTDFAKNYPSFVKRVEEQQWPWEVYNDVNREFRLVMPGSLNGLPQTFILDKEGKVVYHKRKFKSGDEEILFQEIRKLGKG